jgi:hypothetical protein
VALTKVRGAGAEGLTLSSTALTVANGLTLTDGNVTLASGHGLDFASASGDSSGMAAEVFNDYEEGSFTPTFSGGSTTGSGSYSSQTGKYIRVGNKVHIVMSITLSSHTGSGTAFVTGLPYTVGGNAEYTGPVMLNNYDLSGSPVDIVLYANNGNDYLRIYRTVDNGTWASQSLDTNCGLIGSITYFIN